VQGHAAIFLGLQSTVQSTLLAALLAACLTCILLLKLRPRLPSCGRLIPSLSSLRGRKYAPRVHALSEAALIEEEARSEMLEELEEEEEEDVLEDEIEDALADVNAHFTEDARSTHRYMVRPRRLLPLDAATPTVEDDAAVSPAGDVPQQLGVKSLADPVAADCTIVSPAAATPPEGGVMFTRCKMALEADETPDADSVPPLADDTMVQVDARSCLRPPDAMFTRRLLPGPLGMASNRLSVASAAIRLVALGEEENIQPHASIIHEQ
jgi:hypothetical protein